MKITKLLAAVATSGLVTALAPSNAFAQSDVNAHDGVRRISVDGFGGAMFGARGPSIILAGARLSYSLDPHWDVDLAAGYTYVYGASQDPIHRAFLIEGGTTINGRLVRVGSRIGAYGTLGALTNLDAAVMVFGIGAELRFGAGGKLPNSCGFDGRLRLGTRLFQGLNGEVPLDAVYGFELALGFGLGGPRPLVNEPELTARERSIDQLMTIIDGRFGDVVSATARQSFPVCAANVTTALTAIEISGNDGTSGRHACATTPAPGDDVRAATGCTLLLLSTQGDRGDALALQAQDAATPPTTIEGFAALERSAALFACAAGTTSIRWDHVQALRTDADPTQRPVLATIPVSLPADTAAEDAHALPAASATSFTPTTDPQRFLGAVSGIAADYGVVNAPSGHDVVVCVYAPAAAELRVDFLVTPPAPSTLHSLSQGDLRWNSGVCHTFKAADLGQHPTVRVARAANGTTPGALARWPLFVTVRAQQH